MFPIAEAFFMVKIGSGTLLEAELDDKTRIISQDDFQDVQKAQAHNHDWELGCSRG